MKQNNLSKDLKDAADFINSLGPLTIAKNGATHADDENKPEHEQALQLLQEMISGNKTGKPFNQRHIIFICEMIAHGNRSVAYRKAYPDSSFNAAYTNGCRLLAMPHIANYIRDITLALKKRSVEALREKYQGQMTDIEEKRKVLAKIIRGEYTLQKEVKDGEPGTLQKPDMKDVIRAIILDNKMEEEWSKAVSLPDTGIKIFD
jgi:hypothetical protein